MGKLEGAGRGRFANKLGRRLCRTTGGGGDERKSGRRGGAEVEEVEAKAKALTEKAAVLEGEPKDEEIAAIDKEASEFAKDLEKLRQEVLHGVDY